MTDTSTRRRSATGPRDPVEKAFEALRWMLDSPEGSWGVREIARGLGRPPSTVHRTLASLEEQGLVVGDSETGRYSLGLEMFRLAAKISSHFSLRRLAIPTLEQLQGRFNETAFLGLLDPKGKQMMMAALVETTRPLRYVVDANEWRPLYLGASGLAILAFLDADDREQVLKDLDDPTVIGGKLVPIASVRQTIEEVRAQGFARTVGQRVPDALGVAAPVFRPRGTVIGSIGLTLPSSRYDESLGMEQVVVEAAEAFTSFIA
ncbi:IclR family transcriptional regulator [Nocardioides sp. KR10-350]|uniref:IclR family transcriptional regulator n=1 Tax=Nocardioides cheoyonin TaxID=3156615 RepID=UPI0032B5F0AC